MPELPEVEQFRRFLIPLVAPYGDGSNAKEGAPTDNKGSQKDDEVPGYLKVDLVNKDKLPRNWLSEEDVEGLNAGKVICTSVLRKGKQLCLVLKSPKGEHDAKIDANSKENDKDETNTGTKYLFLHMGMTGSIKCPGKTIYWGNNHNSPMAQKEKGGQEDEDSADEAFPPPYAYLTLQFRGYRVAFCDPRKFGKCELSDTLSQMDELAPDALNNTQSFKSDEKDSKEIDADSPESASSQTILDRICNQSIGIKALLLDQKRAVSGVGNWVADELFYQLAMHPDQTHLTESESLELVVKLNEILDCAVRCLSEERSYPDSWLFLYRWTKGKKGKADGPPKDSLGRALTFLKSGGRTSAIVASLQKLQKRSSAKKATTKSSTKKTKADDKKHGAEISTDISDKKEATKRPKATGKRTKRMSTQEDSGQEKANSKRAKSATSKSKKAKIGGKSENDTNKTGNSPPLRRSPRFISP